MRVPADLPSLLIGGAKHDGPLLRPMRREPDGGGSHAVADSRAATGLDESAIRGADDKPSEDTASETPPVMDDDGDEEKVGSRREASPGRRALAED